MQESDWKPPAWERAEMQESDRKRLDWDRAGMQSDWKALD